MGRSGAAEKCCANCLHERRPAYSVLAMDSPYSTIHIHIAVIAVVDVRVVVVVQDIPQRLQHDEIVDVRVEHFHDGIVVHVPVQQREP